MKVEVTSPFLDKFNSSRMYNVGEVVEFEDERAKDMISRRLAKAFEEPKEDPKEEPKEEPKPVVKKPRKRKVEE